MIRLSILVLIVIAAAIAYPVVGIVLGVMVVLCIVMAYMNGRAKRAPRQIAGGPMKVKQISSDGQPELTPAQLRSLPRDVLAARKWAWDELHALERAHGLPPTRRRDR